jgi:hypothetical protein
MASALNEAMRAADVQVVALAVLVAEAAALGQLVSQPWGAAFTGLSAGLGLTALLLREK